MSQSLPNDSSGRRSVVDELTERFARAIHAKVGRGDFDLLTPAAQRRYFEAADAAMALADEVYE